MSDDFAGKRGKCPKCRKSLAVPSSGDAGADRTFGGSTAQSVQADSASLLPLSMSSFAGTATSESPENESSGERLEFLAPPQAADELGRLGHYRVLRILGKGGMGMVFCAEDPVLKRAVALKVMLPHRAESASAPRRFLREAQAMASVKHDHVVTIYQVGEEGGVPFLAMEFLDGEPLNERLRREKRLPAAEVIRLGREIAEGLDAAHARGLIHRDIKPANLWLEGKKARVKILDFGLAWSDENAEHLTGEGRTVGTAAFMAPEQARGTVDGRSDLFSLGVVLYATATGKLPFNGPHTVALLLAVATEDPPPPSEVRPAIPADLSDLIMRLLAKKPAERFQSAADVVRAFEELAHREQSQSKTMENAHFSMIESTPVHPRKKTAKPNSGPSWPRWAAALVGGLALLIALFIFFKCDRDPGPTAKAGNELNIGNAKNRDSLGGNDTDKESAKASVNKKVNSPIASGPPNSGSPPTPPPLAQSPKGFERPIRGQAPKAEEIVGNRRAAELVLERAGVVEVQESYSETLPPITRVDALPVKPFWLTGMSFASEVTDAELRKLDGLKLRAANTVRIENAKNVNGEGLAFLSGCPNLEVLSLAGSSVGKAALEHLRHCPNLGNLFLQRTAHSRTATSRVLSTYPDSPIWTWKARPSAMPVWRLWRLCANFPRCSSARESPMPDWFIFKVAGSSSP